MKQLLFLGIFCLLFQNSWGQNFANYTYNEAGFEVAMPRKPTTEERKIINRIYLMTAAEPDETAYSVLVSKSVNNLESITGMTEKTFQQFAKNCEIKDKQGFTLADRTGIESSIVTQQKLYINYRVIVVGNNAYQLMVACKNKFADQKKVRAFFRSFKIVESQN